MESDWSESVWRLEGEGPFDYWNDILQCAAYRLKCKMSIIQYNYTVSSVNCDYLLYCTQISVYSAQNAKLWKDIVIQKIIQPQGLNPYNLILLCYTTFRIALYFK